MTDVSTQQISDRKGEHLQLALSTDVQGPVPAGWDDVRLVHDCLPEIDVADVDLRAVLLGCRLQAPLWITGMTGGHERAGEINARLARVAERFGLAMGLGSQRAALRDTGTLGSYVAAREAAPSVVLLANIGAPQLVPQDGADPLTLDDLEYLVSTVGAQGLAIHLNFVQEVVQPEGDRRARGCLEAIGRVTASLSVGVMVKETGSGICRRRARDLARAGVGAIDVGGLGGTSMAKIEGARAAGRASLAAAFDHWGIPTAASVMETRDCGVPIVATGGVRSGVDAARAFALGAEIVGVGAPFLRAAHESEAALESAVRTFLEELRLALFLTGCATPVELRRRGSVLSGDLLLWARQRGLLAG